MFGRIAQTFLGSDSRIGNIFSENINVARHMRHWLNAVCIHFLQFFNEIDHALKIRSNRFLFRVVESQTRQLRQVIYQGCCYLHKQK